MVLGLTLVLSKEDGHEKEAHIDELLQVSAAVGLVVEAVVGSVAAAAAVPPRGDGIGDAFQSLFAPF